MKWRLSIAMLSCQRVGFDHIVLLKKWNLSKCPRPEALGQVLSSFDAE